MTTVEMKARCYEIKKRFEELQVLAGEIHKEAEVKIKPLQDESKDLNTELLNLEKQIKGDSNGLENN